MNSIGKYESVIAAKYLRALAFQKGRVLNMTQLQKLLYIAYGSYLALSGNILVDEQPKAWPYGPVFPKVRKQIQLNIVPDPNDKELAIIKEDAQVTSLFSEVIEKYSRFSAKQLSDWSHTTGSPWELTVSRFGGQKWNEPIPNEYIKEYFTRVNV